MGSTTNSSNQTKYFYEINFIRAIACICVVIVHVTARHSSINDGSFNSFSLFLNQITRFGTPMFAVISGFLLYNQAINRSFHIKRFVTSRFTKIIIPFVIWSFIYLYIGSFSISDIKTFEDLKNFLFSFSLGKSYFHLYFISIVIQFYLLFPIIQLLKSKKWLITLTICTFYLNYFYIQEPFIVGAEDGFLNEFLHDRAFLFYWLFYFFLGGLFVHYWPFLMKWVKENTKHCIALGVLVLIFMIYDYNVFGFSNSTSITNLFNVPILFISLASIYFYLKRYEWIRNGFVQLGNLSMGIYLVHPLIIYFINNYAIWLLDSTRWIIMAILLTLFLSILLVKILHKFPFGQYVVIVAGKKKQLIKPKVLSEI